MKFFPKPLLGENNGKQKLDNSCNKNVRLLLQLDNRFNFNYFDSYIEFNKHKINIPCNNVTKK